MCFFATTSFGSDMLPLATGTMTLCMTRCPAGHPYAAIPLLFAIQQFVEGVVWLSFGGPAWLNSVATQVYSFFSHALWPVYVPLATWLLEPRGPRRRGLLAFVAMGLVVGAYLLYSLVVNPIRARPMASHADYQSPHFYIVASMTLHLLSATVNLLLSSHVWVKVFGALTLAASFTAYVFYVHWSISVWCFFAALLSGAIALRFIALRPIPQQRIPL